MTWLPWVLLWAAPLIGVLVAGIALWRIERRKPR